MVSIKMDKYRLLQNLKLTTTLNLNKTFNQLLIDTF